ncbi:MAG: hypothetical protein P8Y97_22645 [Candidatus Lokiarchaeota archaeon]
MIFPLVRNKNDLLEDINIELKAKEEGWIIVKNPEEEESIELALKLSQEMGLGESYAIALSNELNVDLLLIHKKVPKIDFTLVSYYNELSNFLIQDLLKSEKVKLRIGQKDYYIFKILSLRKGITFQKLGISVY